LKVFIRDHQRLGFSQCLNRKRGATFTALGASIQFVRGYAIAGFAVHTPQGVDIPI
jgi:hypothetical protein